MLIFCIVVACTKFHFSFASHFSHFSYYRKNKLEFIIQASACLKSQNLKALFNFPNSTVHLTKQLSYSMSQFLFLKTKSIFVLPLLLLGNMPCKRSVHVLLETKDLTCFFQLHFLLVLTPLKDKNKNAEASFLTSYSAGPKSVISKREELHRCCLRACFKFQCALNQGFPTVSKYILSKCPFSSKAHAGCHSVRAQENSGALATLTTHKPLGQKSVCSGFSDLTTYCQNANK